MNNINMSIVIILLKDITTHLSPGISLIYDLAYDSGMLQSELFTSRN